MSAADITADGRPPAVHARPVARRLIRFRPLPRRDQAQHLPLRPADQDMERGGLRLAVQRRLDRAAGRLGLRGGDHVIGMHRPRHHPGLALVGPGPHPQPSRAAHPPHASPPPGRLLRSGPPRGHRAVPAQRLQVTAQEVLCGAHVPRLRRRPAAAPQPPRCGQHQNGHDDRGRAPARRTPPAAAASADHPPAVTQAGRPGNPAAGDSAAASTSTWSRARTSAPCSCSSRSTPTANTAVARTRSGQPSRSSRSQPATKISDPAATAQTRTRADGTGHCSTSPSPLPGAMWSSTSPPLARALVRGKNKAVNSPPRLASAVVTHSHAPSSGGRCPASYSTSTSSSRASSAGLSHPARLQPAASGVERSMISLLTSYRWETGIPAVATDRPGLSAVPGPRGGEPPPTIDAPLPAGCQARQGQPGHHARSTGPQEVDGRYM